MLMVATMHTMSCVMLMREGYDVRMVMVEEVLQEDHKLLDVSPNHQESVPPRPTRLKLHGA